MSIPVLSAFFGSLVLPSYALIRMYTFIIGIAVLFSWIRAAGLFHRTTRAAEIFEDSLNALTQPYLRLFRKFIPAVGIIDISSVVAIFVLLFLRDFIPTLFYMASQYFA